MTGKVIFLNGATSCGKTTVARCMQALSRDSIYVFSNDIFHGMVSGSTFKSYWHMVAHSITTQYYSARGAVDAGNIVVIDGMLLDLPEYVELFGKRNIELVTEIFAGTDITMVNMTCPASELRRRNILRGDRAVHQSDEQLELMTGDASFDLSIDVMTHSPCEAAEMIIRRCGLNFDKSERAIEYAGGQKSRFISNILSEFGASVDYIAASDDADAYMSMITAASVDSTSSAAAVAEELLRHGYEQVSDMRFTRASGETLKIRSSGDEGVSESMDYLGRRVRIKIDRPAGSAHPKYRDMIYHINYGYVDGGIIMPDGDEIDAYLIGINEPLGIDEYADGSVAAVIHRRDDDEDKLVVIPDGVRASISRQEIRAAVDFTEKYFDSNIYMDVK